MPRVRILSVGQCGYDHGQISGQFKRQIDAEVFSAGTHNQAMSAIRAGHFDLVLVNRIGDDDGAPGLDLIRTLKSDPGTASLPVMLVSNYAEAQADAVSLGALPGFGKADLGKNALPPNVEEALSTPRH